MQEIDHPNLLRVLAYWTDEKKERLVYITEDPGKPLKRFIA